MESSVIVWTENDEIENYQAGNTMMDFVGYIESMLQLSQVKTYQKYIYKVIMNNNRGTKVRVVFWSNKAVEWSSKLSLYQIIEVTGCTVADVKFQYDSDLKGVIAPQELHVQEFSTINVLGMFNQANAIVEQEVIYTETSIETCLEHGRQPIAVGGYVKNEFQVFRTVGSMSLANGNIADGCYRLAVLIRGFKPMPELTKGAYATFHGRIENSKPGSALLSVDDMTKVTVDGSKKKLTVEQLRLAIRQPSTKSTSTTAKRPGDDDKENADGNKDSEKKMKTD